MLIVNRGKTNQSNKIQQLKNDFIPKEEEIGVLKETIELIEDDLTANHKRNEQLRNELHGMKLKLSSLKNEAKMKEEEVLLQRGEISYIEIKLKEASKLTDNAASLKKHLINLYHRTIGIQSGAHNTSIKAGRKCSDKREWDYLKKKIKSIEDIIERRKKTHAINMKRLKHERKKLLKVRHQLSKD